MLRPFQPTYNTKKSNKSPTGGMWRTTSDGSKVYFGPDGKVRGGGPTGPVLDGGGSRGSVTKVSKGMKGKKEAAKFTQSSSTGYKPAVEKHEKSGEPKLNKDHRGEPVGGVIKTSHGEFTLGVSHRQGGNIPGETAYGVYAVKDPSGEKTTSWSGFMDDSVASDFRGVVDHQLKVRNLGGEPYKELFDHQKTKSPKATKSLSMYFGSSESVQMNAAMRSGRSHWLAKDNIKAFKKNSVPIPTNIETYRVVKGTNPQDLFATRPGRKVSVGDVVEDRAFFSTTASKSYAEGYDADAVKNMGFTSEVKSPQSMITVHVPAGTKAIAYREHAEAEVLLGPGSRFRVKSLSPIPR